MVEFLGESWFYDFTELPVTFKESRAKVVVGRLSQDYSVLTKDWDISKNTEWTLRLYLAAKLILSATLQVNSADYAEQHNLRAVVPYLKYYSLLSLVRAIGLTLPTAQWQNGELIQVSHTKAINYAINHLSQFDGQFAQDAKLDIYRCKADRELLSYRAPSVGDSQIVGNGRFLSLCAVLGEIAQLNSEILERSIQKHADPASFNLDQAAFHPLTNVEITGTYYGDTEDAYRLDYLYRKHPRPTNILHFMKEGHVDDFFGAWCAISEDAIAFNPDKDQQIIFQIP